MRSTTNGFALAALVTLSAMGARADTDAPSAASRAITAPSGSHPMGRARQCEAQATQKGLQGNARQAFYKSCLASAAPTGAVGSKAQIAVPAAAKPKLDTLTDAPRH